MSVFDSFFSKRNRSNSGSSSKQDVASLSRKGSVQAEIRIEPNRQNNKKPTNS